MVRVSAAAAAAKSLQSCLTLCDPIDGSPPGSPIPGVLQARTLEWVAIASPMHESEKWKGSHSVVSDSQRPHGLQPTRLLHPWDFPGKSTGLGCHCLLRVVRAGEFKSSAASDRLGDPECRRCNLCWPQFLTQKWEHLDNADFPAPTMGILEKMVMSRLGRLTKQALNLMARLPSFLRETVVVGVRGSPSLSSMPLS